MLLWILMVPSALANTGKVSEVKALHWAISKFEIFARRGKSRLVKLKHAFIMILE